MSTPELTADAIAIYGNKIVLVERNTEPEGLALPGGHQEPNETLAATAAREMREETGLNFIPEHQVGVYDDPNRDLRGNKVSVVYAGEAYGDPSSQEEATDVSLFPLSDLEDLREDIVFDHGEIISDYLDGTAESKRGSKRVKEPDNLILYSNRKGSKNVGDLQMDSYSSVKVPESLEEGKRMLASNADGVLAATLPVEDHPDLGETYVVGARIDKTYKNTLYDGSTEKKTKTSYPVIEVEEPDVQDTVDEISEEYPEWIKVGAKVKML